MDSSLCPVHKMMKISYFFFLHSCSRFFCGVEGRYNTEECTDSKKCTTTANGRGFQEPKFQLFLIYKDIFFIYIPPTLKGTWYTPKTEQKQRKAPPGLDTVIVTAHRTRSTGRCKVTPGHQFFQASPTKENILRMLTRLNVHRNVHL